MVTFGSAPPSATTRSARLVPCSGCGTRKRQRSSGSATVADRPVMRETRRKPPQPRQAERQQIAALGGHQRVQLVEHDALEAAEQIGRVGAGQQQRELFGRGQQDVGRIAALALALRGRRVAGAGLDADRQAHLARPAFRGCARCRPRAPSAARCRACAGRRERRSSLPVETIRRGLAPRSLKLHQASAESPPASCRRRSARSAAPSGRRGRAPAVPADARAGVQPREANQREKFSGSSGAVSIFFARLMSSGCYLPEIAFFTKLSL